MAQRKVNLSHLLQGIMFKISFNPLKPADSRLDFASFC